MALPLSELFVPRKKFNGDTLSYQAKIEAMG